MSCVRRIHPAACLLLVWCAVTPASTASAKNSQLARALAPRLKPLGLTEKAEPQWLSQIVRDQIIPILSAMQSSTQAGGPDGRSLVSTAFEIQSAMGDVQKMTVLSNLVQMWQEARALGCFNAEHRFSGEITKGPDAGAQAVFEYIVPLQHAPKFSRDLSNVRLVSPAKSREKGGANAERDLAFGKQLLAVEHEITGMIALRKFENGPPPKKVEPTNSLGQTQAEHLRLFDAEMKLAGDAALKAPIIRLVGRLTEQPMKRNGYQWSYTVELTNLSPYPTEVIVEWWLIGDTEIKHLNYLMAEGEQTPKLRSAGIERLEFKTKSKSHYDGRADDLDGLAAKDPMRGRTETKYRGAVIRVIHGKDKKTVATWTSDATMARALSEDPGEQYDLDRLPRLYENDPKNY